MGSRNGTQGTVEVDTVKKEQTQQSIADGFGGDLFRRRMVSENAYQCGCEWKREPGYGDVLHECVFHQQCHGELEKELK